MSLRALSFAVLSCSLLAAPLAAQDPPPPPGGFGVAVTSNLAVTWADGYQTLMDVYQPAVAPPGTGWPGVLVVHGGGGSKNVAHVVAACTSLARAGYVTYAYDGRGEGSTPALNPGWPSFITPEEELHDSAESHGVAQGFVPGAIDPTRLGVTGHSRGGQHSTLAAAYSGKAIPCAIAGCPITQYPTILAAAPENIDLDWLEKFMPGQTIVNDEGVDDMGPTNPFLVLLDANDYAGAYAWLQTQFYASVLPLLRQSTVPVFLMLAWQDHKLQPNCASDDLFTLLPGVPRRLLLTTGGHATPRNDMETALLTETRTRWFDHFLKGIANGAEAEVPVEVAMQADQPDYLDLSSIWEHRNSQTWPPAIALTTFHLRGNGSLTEATPPAVEPGPTLIHNVAAGYDAITYVGTHASVNPPLLFAHIPLVTRDFVSSPLAETQEIGGRVHVVLHVDDTTGIFQLSVELKHVSPMGVEQHISLGAGGIRSGVAGAQVLEFDLGDIAHVVPAGDRVIVRVMNLAYHHPPGYQFIRFVPYFSSTQSTVEIGPATPSHVAIPMRPYITNLAPRLAIESSAAGISHPMRLDGGALRAGWPYVVLLGGSGEAPGLTLPGFPPLPLNFDALTQAGAAASNGAVLPAFFGNLDAAGIANPSVAVPPGALPALAGVRFTFAGYVLDPTFQFEAFGPATLLVSP